MHCRCKIIPLQGYCKESSNNQYFISFISPCRAGLKILSGEKVTSCPAYIDSQTELSCRNADYSDLIGGEQVPPINSKPYDNFR